MGSQSLFFVVRGLSAPVRETRTTTEKAMQLEIGECHESINDALQGAVKALGGYKKVGPMLRPEMTVDVAAGWLRDCLNPTRREKLSPEQVLYILRAARQAGYYAAMDFVAFDTGYRATPVEPETQERQLQERFINAVEGLTAIQAQLQRIQRLRSAA